MCQPAESGGTGFGSDPAVVGVGADNGRSGDPADAWMLLIAEASSLASETRKPPVTTRLLLYVRGC